MSLTMMRKTQRTGALAPHRRPAGTGARLRSQDGAGGDHCQQQGSLSTERVTLWTRSIVRAFEGVDGRVDTAAAGGVRETRTAGE